MDLVRFNSMHTAAQERVWGLGVKVMRAVPVCSAASRRRNHDAIDRRRKTFSATSPTSNTITPKPPPCRRRSVALSACSALPLQLIQSNRLSSRPASDADSGSKLPLPSIHAPHSPVSKVRESTETAKAVRFDDGDLAQGRARKASFQKCVNFRHAGRETLAAFDVSEADRDFKSISQVFRKAAYIRHLFAYGIL